MRGNLVASVAACAAPERADLHSAALEGQAAWKVGDPASRGRFGSARLLASFLRTLWPRQVMDTLLTGV
jgi:hypothetical protein